MSHHSATSKSSFPVLALSNVPGFYDTVPVNFAATENDPVDYDALTTVCPNPYKDGELTSMCRALLMKAAQHYSRKRGMRLRVFFSSDDHPYIYPEHCSNHRLSVMDSKKSENRLAKIAAFLLGYFVLGGFLLGAAALLYEALKYCFGWTHTLPYMLVISEMCFTYLAMDRNLSRSEKFAAALPLSITIAIGAIILKALFSFGSGDSDEGFSSLYRGFNMPFWASIFVCYVFFNFNEADRRDAIENYRK